MFELEPASPHPLPLFEVLVDEYQHQMLARLGTACQLPQLYGEALFRQQRAFMRTARRELLAQLKRKYADVPDVAQRQHLIRTELQPLLVKQKEQLRQACAATWRTAVQAELAACYERYGLPLQATNQSTRLGDELTATLATRINQELVKDFYARLHAAQRRKGHRPATNKRVALCFSGGGIRTATFGLGVLQGLASQFDLSQIHYLSTVSGGGYLGSWFSAWVHRRGLAEVQRELGADWRAGAEAATVNHLRRYSNYMSPRLGLFTADTWTLLATYLRNLLLSWSVLLPLLAAFLLLPVLFANALQPLASEPDRTTVPWQVSLQALALLVSLAAGIWAVRYILVFRGGTGNLNQLASDDDTGFLQQALGPLWLSALSAVAYWSWTNGQGEVLQQLLRRLFQPAGMQGGDVSGTLAGGASLWSVVGTTLLLLVGLSIVFWLLGWLPFVLLRQAGLRAFAPTWGASLLNASLCCAAVIAVAYTRQHPTVGAFVAFVTFGILYNHGGVLLAHPLKRLRVPDYAYGVFVGAMGGICLYLLAVYVFTEPAAELKWFVCFGPPLFLATLMLAATLSIGLTSYYSTDGDREWMARSGGWILLTMAAWCVLCGISLFATEFWQWAWHKFQTPGESWVVSLLSLVGGGSGIATLLGGWSRQSAATKEKAKEPEKKGMLAGLGDLLPLLAAPVFALTVLLLLAQAGQALGTLLGSPGLAFFLLAALGMLMGLFINVNKFSLHSTYRDRLIRAYLGASRHPAERRPNRFTGLDEQDNLQMHELPVAVLNQQAFSDLDGLIKRIAQAAAQPSLLNNGETPATTELAEQKIAQFVFRSFAPDTRDLVRSFATTTPERKSLTRTAVIEGLNQLIQRSPFYSEAFFDTPVDDITPLSTFARMLTRMVEEFWFGKPPDIRAAFMKLLEGDLVAVGTLRGLAAAQPILQPTWKRRLSWLRLRRMQGSRVYVHRLLINRELLRLAFRDCIAAQPRYVAEPRPLHVINIALNLVAGQELAWQERKAQSFTVSPLHVGSAQTGFRRAWSYSLNQRNGSALSLGTALAISGAAASPNMGYHSSSVVTFLLALFNVRLGWWSGNPGAAGNQTYMFSSPSFAPGPLFNETFGRTNDQHKYVYLSDGGHFENLALYEMVRRRCHFIILSDGGQDGEFAFEDLGNALRKIRIDLGVPIEFTEIPLHKRLEDLPIFDRRRQAANESGRALHKYCALGRIRYSAVDVDKDGQGDPAALDGWLLYLKPTIYGSEPADVYNYAKAHPTFPHETTGDQYFSESQFESYRELGRYTIEQVIGNGTCGDVAGLFACASDHLGYDNELVKKDKKAIAQTVQTG